MLSFAFQKRTFAQYWDHVDDPREISSVSRFLSGGIGGITSQLSELPSFSMMMAGLNPHIRGIYPLETLKVVAIIPYSLALN